MKYGQTLRQRSIPEWAHHNINYDEIKQLIKQHTTPGTNKPVSIPGQGDVSEKEFEHHLSAILAEQHQYIVLFVKSKTHEIDGRLNHLRRQLSQLEARQAANPGPRIPPKRLARLSRLEDDILKTGEEIRSLAQFVNVQKLAFIKLLKKYKKWSGSDNLGEQFKENVLNHPGSIARVDVGPLLDQFLEILQDVRDLVRRPAKPKDSVLTPASSERTNKLPQGSKPLRESRFPAARLQSTIETGSDGDLDIALATCPLGDAGCRAVYWVHPEQVLELKILLLQHTRPFPVERRRSGKSTPSTRAMPPLSRRDSGASERISETHVMMMDDMEAFAKAQSGATVKDAENAAGGVVTRTAGVGLWTGNAEAHVVLGATMVGDTASAIVKPKHLGGLLDRSRPFERKRSSVQFQADVQAVDMANDYDQKTKQVRRWLTDRPKVNPLVLIHSRRDRFVGLNNDATQGTWATLDTDITMSQAPKLEEMGGEWWNDAKDLTEFPFAILDVRQEGERGTDLIKILDDNHLTERVRGFSIETHAVWSCCQPRSMSAPFWLPLLSKDIRKVPSSGRQPSKITIETDTSSPTGPPSTDATSVTTGGLASSSSGNMISSTSITSPSDNPQSAKRVVSISKRKKVQKPSLPVPPTEDKDKMNGDATVPRYWSEYDHPEDGSDEEGFYLYIDPNASTKFPGQELVEKLYGSIRSIFNRKSSSASSIAERDALLARDYFNGPARDFEDNDSTTSGDQSPTTTRPSKNYGTLTAAFGGLGGQESSHDTLDVFRNVFHDSPHAETASRPGLGGRYDPLSGLNLPSLEARQDELKGRMSMLSFLASATLLVVVFTLAATGRKKLYEQVDAGLIVGIVANLCFAILGLIYTFTRHDAMGWLRKTLVCGAFATVCVLDGVLVGWMFA